MRGIQGIGGHTLPNKGKDVVWLTPPSILQALGKFDLDPCAAPPPRPWLTATHHFDGQNYNGLDEPWFGRVYLNPPYDESLVRWMEKMARHANGIALTFARTETDIWQRWIWPFADSVLFISGRLYFHFPDGSRAKGSAGGPSALIAYSSTDTEALCESGIAGVLVKVQRRNILGDE